jgi:hypothetical protein
MVLTDLALRTPPHTPAFRDRENQICGSPPRGGPPAPAGPPSLRGVMSQARDDYSGPDPPGAAVRVAARRDRHPDPRGRPGLGPTERRREHSQVVAAYPRSAGHTWNTAQASDRDEA